MNRTKDGRPLHGALLKAVLAAGFGASSAFGASAPASAPAAAPADSPAPSNANGDANAKKVEKGKFDDMVDAYGKCQNGTLDLVGARDPAAAARYRALFDGEVSEVRRSLELHQACLASVPGEEKSCDALVRSKGWSADCRDLVEYSDFLAALFDKGDALAACEPFAAQVARKEGAKTTRTKGGHIRGCDVVIPALKRGTSSFCSEAKASGVFRGDERKYNVCKESLSYLDGIPDHCASDPDKSDQSLCREKASLLSSIRSKDFQACALTPWCVAMTSHRTESCDPYLVRATKAFCGKVAAVAGPVVKAREAREEQLRAIASKQKRIYAKGAPMQTSSTPLEKRMKEIEAIKQ